MAYQDNGLIDLSTSISHVEIALHEYTLSPQLGLKKLHVCLTSFQNFSNSLIELNDVFHQRLSSLLDSVGYLLNSGSPYFKHYHIAFMSACDALFQIVVASRVGLNRVQQLYALLSVELSCWTVILSTKNDTEHSLVHMNYEAQVTSDALFQDQTIDSYLKALSAVGRVSFHLDVMQDSFISGCYKLSTVQSIEWLQSCFPNFNWSVVSTNETKSLKELCELSFLPLFQNGTMARDYRYRLLSLFERQFRALCYRPFGALFLSDSSETFQTSRLVPAEENIDLFKNDELLSYFPVRHCGFVYAASKVKGNETTDFSFLRCLGRDFLSYFLYEVSTCFGRFVFDQQDCVGVHKVSEQRISIVDGVAWFELGNGIEVEIVLDFPLTTLREGAFCVLPIQVTDVLVIKQAEKSMAIPFFALRKIEGVSSQMASPSSSVKNIWLSKKNEPLVEPWLLKMPNITIVDLPASNSIDPHASLSKGGYYLGVINERSFLIDAELVSLVLPYRPPLSLLYFDDDTQKKSFFIHEGRCFDNISSEIGDTDCSSPAEKNYSFSAILDWMDVNVVLSFESCDWLEILPDEHDIQELDDTLLNGKPENKKNRFSSLSDRVRINKKNYLSFVAGSLPSSSLA